MVELADIRSLSDFQRNTREHLRHLKRRGAPLVLTVNGKAEVVVQDAQAYQKLLALLEEAEVVVTLRQRLASLQQGIKARSFENALEDLGKKYEPAPKR